MHNYCEQIFLLLAGMERFEAMSKAYYRDAVGALLVYDVTNPASFERLKTYWMKQLRDYGHEKIAIMLGSL